MARNHDKQHSKEPGKNDGTQGLMATIADEYPVEETTQTDSSTQPFSQRSPIMLIFCLSFV